MRILLLGSNGQLGSDLCRRAARDFPQFDIIPLNRDRLDVTELGKIKPTIAEEVFDVLINCTSYHRTDEAESNTALALKVNGFAVQKMAEAAHEKGARFVHISTDFVFGDGIKGDRPITEKDPTGAFNIYGSSKLMGEGMALEEWDNTLIFRVASLFGIQGPSGKGANFVETMIRLGRENGSLRVVNDQVMSPTSTDDLAWMILTALDKRCPPGIYHAVNSSTASWYDFAVEIIKQTGLKASVTPIPSSEYPTPARRPAYSALDNSKLAAIVGDIPPWRDALTRYLKAKGHIEEV